MIKLLCFASASALAALFYSHEPVETELTSFFPVETEDRIFLAALNAEESAQAARAARADQMILAAQTDAPVAVAVPSIPPKKPEPMPIPRALAVASVSAPPAFPAVPAVATAGPEIRRAVPVPSGRASIVIYRGEVVVTPGATARR